MSDPVTVDHAGLSVTTNTLSEAELRAELTRGDAAPDAETAPADAPVKERDEKGRFVKREASPASTSEAAPEPAPEAAPPEPPALPRHDPVARMTKALAQKAEAERRAAALEAELQRLRQPVTPPVTPSGYNGAGSAPPSIIATNGHGEPQFEQFADQPDPYTAYLQAWARWDRTQAITAARASWDAEQTAKAQQATFHARITEGAQAHADWQEALTQADTLGLQVSEVMRAAIETSPRAADLVHYLATHPETCTQLAEESIGTPVAAATVMRRLLESHLAVPAVSPGVASGSASRPVSTAKPPIRPVGSSPVVSDAPPGDDATAAEHARYWNRKLKVPGTK